MRKKLCLDYSSRSSSFIGALSVLVRHDLAVKQDKAYRVSESLF